MSAFWGGGSRLLQPPAPAQPGPGAIHVAGPPPPSLLQRLDPIVDHAMVAAAEPEEPPQAIATLDEALAEARGQERRARKRQREAREAEEAEEVAEERHRILNAVRHGRDPFPIRCVLCAYGDLNGFDGTSPAGNKAFATLVNMFKTGVSNNARYELCARAASYYAVHLFEPSVDTDWELPVQTADTFLTHLNEHTLNPVLHVAKLQKACFDQIDDVLLHYQTDKRATDKLIKLFGAAKALLTIPKNGTYFGQHLDLIELDPAAQGELANTAHLRPVMATNRRNTIGGATATDMQASEAARAQHRVFGLLPQGSPGTPEAPDDEPVI